MATIKKARFMREVTSRRPESWFVIQHLFRVTPPMEWTDYATFYKGRLLQKERGNPLPYRMKTGLPVRMPDGTWGKQQKGLRLYTYRDIHRHTAFVIASASALDLMMKRSYRTMREHALARGDKETADLFAEKDDHLFQPEVYLFPCDKYGNWKNGGEMEGSERGTLDHNVPFNNMGYTVIGLPEPRPIKEPRDPLILKATII